MQLMQVFSSFALCGFIWVVQLVHYPTFSRIPAETFSDFELFHGRRICWIVVPLMFAELLSAAWLLLAGPASFWGAQLALCLLTLAIWGSTFFIQVPLHRRLVGGKNEVTIRILCRSNWIRTALWTIKSALLLVMLAQGWL